MKFGLQLVFLFLFMTLIPVRAQNLNSMNKEILAKNKVQKIFDYVSSDYSDSLKFKREHPNGSYDTYNKEGQRIEYNWYAMKEDENGNESFEECKTYDVYDYYGEHIGSVSINPASEDRVQYIDIQDKNSKTGKIKSLKFNGGSVSFDEKMEENNDTIYVSKFHKRIYYRDSSMVEDIYLNKSLLIDSTILTYEVYEISKGAGPRDDKKKGRIKSVYSLQNGLNLRVKCEFSEQPYTQLTQTWEMNYLENGLLDFVCRYSYDSKKENKTQYVYIYRD